MTEEVKSSTAKIIVEAVSIRNRSIKNQKSGKWAKVEEGIDLKRIQKGDEYEVSFVMNGEREATITDIKFPEPANPELEQSAGNEPQSTAGKDSSPKDEPLQADKDLRITRLATIERAMNYLGVNQGKQVDIGEVFKISEQMACYVYKGLPRNQPENAKKQAPQPGPGS